MLSSETSLGMQVRKCVSCGHPEMLSVKLGMQQQAFKPLWAGVDLQHGTTADAEV